jgi:hypothetical protein
MGVGVGGLDAEVEADEVNMVVLDYQGVGLADLVGENRKVLAQFFRRAKPGGNALFCPSEEFVKPKKTQTTKTRFFPADCKP